MCRYWCPANSTSATAHACAPGTFGTPLGAGWRYTSDACNSCNASWDQSSDSYLPVPSGMHCPAATPGYESSYCRGVNGQTLCFYNVVAVLPFDSVACPPGFYCNGGTSQPLPCACLPGTSQISAWQDDTYVCGICNPGTVCAGGTAQPVDCAALPGTYCPSNYSDIARGVPCPTSYYCTGGTAQPQNCDTPVSNYCPVGSSSMSGVPCAAGSYCLGGSSTPGSCGLVDCHTVALDMCLFWAVASSSTCA